MPSYDISALNKKWEGELREVFARGYGSDPRMDARNLQEVRYQRDNSNGSSIK